jgi:NH3-dependent NAD+ synthetase
MSRRLAAIAVLTPALALLSACDQVNAAADKATVCTQALNLVTLVPNPDPEKTRQEAADKAKQAEELATDVQNADVKGALDAMAQQYVEASKKSVEELSNFAGWTAELVKTQENLRKACL